jgi:hypothetical protein
MADKIIFQVVITESPPYPEVGLVGDHFIAKGESDGSEFEFDGDLDTIYHEIENQLDSATTRMQGGE